MRRFVTFALVAAIAVACGGSDSDEDGKASGKAAPCGAPPGDWVYLFSCDSIFGGLVHQCTDYYATKGAASAVDATFRSTCNALNGSVFDGVCPSEGSAGSCLNTSSSGPTATSPLAMLSRTYAYGKTNPASYKNDCEDENGVYVPPAGALDVPAPPPTVASCASEDSGSGSSSVAFSVQVVANGEVIQCTNYIGKVTAAELDSVRQQGALTTPCPAANAICSCKGPGIFGTEALLVYYASKITGDDTTCPNSDASCKPSYTPP